MSATATNLRQQMPQTAAFIDALRDAFGAEGINASIKRGMSGQGGFWAKEGGFEVGTKPGNSGKHISPAYWPEQHARDLAGIKKGKK